MYLLPVMHPGQCGLPRRGVVVAADLVQCGMQAVPYLFVGCAPSLVHEVLDHSPWAEGGAVAHVLGNGQTEDLFKIHHSIRLAERALGTNS
jgi:hypothetical protein